MPWAPACSSTLRKWPGSGHLVCSTYRGLLFWCKSTRGMVGPLRRLGPTWLLKWPLSLGQRHGEGQGSLFSMFECLDTTSGRCLVSVGVGGGRMLDFPNMSSWNMLSKLCTEDNRHVYCLFWRTFAQTKLSPSGSSWLYSNFPSSPPNPENKIEILPWDHHNMRQCAIKSYTLFFMFVLFCGCNHSLMSP